MDNYELPLTLAEWCSWFNLSLVKRKIPIRLWASDSLLSRIDTESSFYLERLDSNFIDIYQFKNEFVNFELEK